MDSTETTREDAEEPAPDDAAVDPRGGGWARAGTLVLGGLANGGAVGLVLGLLEARSLAASYRAEHLNQHLPTSQYLHTAALDALGFAVVGGLVAVLWLVVPVELTPIGLGRRLWALRRAGPQQGARVTAAGWSLIVTALVGFAGALVVSRYLLFNHQARALIAVALAGGFVVGGGLLWLLHRTLRFHLERLLCAVARRNRAGALLVGPVLFGALLLAAAVAVTLVLWVRFGATVRALPWDLIAYLVGGLAAILLGTDLYARWGWRYRLPLAAGVVVLATAVFGVSFARFGNAKPERRIAAAIDRFGVVAPRILRPLTRWSDGDRDGFGGRFGGGDCNDHNRNIHPAAAEIPGNGIDENCSGEDLPDAATILPRPPPRTRVTARSTPLAQRPNILWIVIDAMRADRGGWVGYQPRITPNLDRLARRSLQFTRAYSTSNRTAVVFSELLTGRYASELHRKGVYNIVLTAQNRFVASLFQKAGYATLGSVCHHSMNREHGRHRGFDRWRVFHSQSRHQFKREVTAPRTNRNALALLEAHLLENPPEQGRRKPFFLLNYYFDPHWHYLRHEGYGAIDGKRIRNPYDVEIHFTDAHVGRLLRWLERRGELKNTIVVVTADHGEAFGEHGEHRHGYNLYEEQIRVPLLLHVPGRGTRRIDSPVSLMDLPRTLLELASIGTDWTLQGRSLVPLFGGGPAPSRVIYAEQLPSRDSTLLRAIIVGRWKLIHRPRGNLYELFDLEKDPREKNNLADRLPKQFRRLRQMYEAFVATRLKQRPSLGR